MMKYMTQLKKYLNMKNSVLFISVVAVALLSSCYSDSWRNEMKEELYDEIKEEVYDELKSELHDDVKDEVYDELKSELYEELIVELEQ